MTLTEVALVAILVALIWTARAMKTNTSKVIESMNWLNSTIVENGRYLYGFNEEYRRVKGEFTDSGGIADMKIRDAMSYLSLLKDIEEKTMLISVDVDEIKEHLSKKSRD
jgi:hypothetical protein